jgi:hypothetical protein
LFALPNMLDIFTPVRSGVYKDKSKAFRWWMKMTPFKNIYEAQAPYSKLNYLKNQLM